MAFYTKIMKIACNLTCSYWTRIYQLKLRRVVRNLSFRADTKRSSLGAKHLRWKVNGVVDELLESGFAGLGFLEHLLPAGGPEDKTHITSGGKLVINFSSRYPGGNNMMLYSWGRNFYIHFILNPSTIMNYCWNSNLRGSAFFDTQTRCQATCCGNLTNTITINDFNTLDGVID